MRRPGVLALCVWGVGGVVACDATDMIHEPEWTLSRMLDQPRYDPYAPSPFFADGRAMRAPVKGTVPRDALLGSPALMVGSEGGTYAAASPVPVTRALLDEGHEHFEIVCATCHGTLGDGNSPVAAKMQIRKPPSLLTPDIAALPPGRIYGIILKGYGLMPAVDYQLDVRERWAVVAYLGALQRSRGVAAGDLPPAMRAALEKAAP